MNKDDSKSLQRFKRRAKLLARERAVSHSMALEIQAEIEGFLDYEEAKFILNGLVDGYPDSWKVGISPHRGSELENRAYTERFHRS